MHFNIKDKVIEKWSIKPCKIDNNKYVMKLNKIEQICTSKQIISINFVPTTYDKYNGCIKIRKDCGNNKTKKISYSVPNGFGRSVKQRLSELILDLR